MTDPADNLTANQSSGQICNDDNQTSMAGFTYDLDGSPTSYLQRQSNGGFNPVTLIFDQESCAKSYSSFTAKTYPDGVYSIRLPSGSFGYDNANRMIEQTNANGSTVTYTNDSENRTTDILHKTAGGATLAHYAYAYDAGQQRHRFRDVETRKRDSYFALTQGVSAWSISFFS